MAAGSDGQDEGEITAYFGHIDPFFGQIDPFFGQIDPFFGHINPFYADGNNNSFGDISPFWGTIEPFWGTINPFFGDIAPFWGDISPFFGHIDPFYETDPEFYDKLYAHYGDLRPFWGDIAAFWGDVGPMFGDIDAFWGDIRPFEDHAGDWSELAAMLSEVDAQAGQVWGAAIEARTGLSYREGFADALYAKYGIDLDDPSTLEDLSAGDRSMFFMEFYDGLMGFSGVDHVDHWMATINWRPSITQDLGGGADARIGLLDANVNFNDDLLDNISKSEGYKITGNFHGAAVGSLLVGAHDGKGVMGIAPDADVILYNPFDETGTSNWDDIGTGIEKLTRHKVDVINMSLGMPGWTFNEGWSQILGNSKHRNKLEDVLVVKAAGNDGIAQQMDVTWNADTNLLDQLIIVGSVGPTKQISWFSNTPGEACIVTWNYCAEHNKLKYKYVVAPGEMILVADDDGGVQRVSGTSFAAPLVSGTATLIMDRWPWLQRNPELVADIIFNTAEDLGEPGVDSVYGWGLLDVEAALSPYAFDSLSIFSGWNYVAPQKLKDAILTPGVLDVWEEKGVVLSSFEYYPGGYRDFLIPLSSRVAGEEYSNWASKRQRTQGYLYKRLIDWAKNGSGFAEQPGYTAPVGAGQNWRLSMTATPRSVAEERRIGEVPFHSDLMLASVDGALTMRAGTGEATPLFAASEAFGFASDIDPMSGGVNPVFGFASGSGYAGTALSLTGNAQVSLSFAARINDRKYQDVDTGQLLADETGLAPYQAQAASLGFDYRLTDRVSMNVSYTVLDETDGLLGAQGGGALSLDGKAGTSSTTMGVDVALPRNMLLGMSATRAETQETEFEDSILSLTDGASSSAYEVAILKRGIAGIADQLRFSFAQPLHVEDGALEMTMLAVVDRETGDLGQMTQYVPLGGSRRPYVAELLYASPVLKGRGNLGTFTRAETNTRSSNAGIVEYSFGTNLRLSF
ncbi:hypothetical protein GCM10011342_14560 [Aquisalinus flavus]|uniref:Peptidase S8/S53 domain-containing protein n=2 Tax=Aquisalinus flavus TaxID=1526572 RepID=A0A8J2V202_9PROT|nr:hypothetical protein GCM10011342_14560 [Aquisalinus flavus]